MSKLSFRLADQRGTRSTWPERTRLLGLVLVLLTIAFAGFSQALDLDDVKNIAEVTLNRKPLGVLWKAPFRWM